MYIRSTRISQRFPLGTGACVQILLFGILSIEIKRKAPRAHTVCEIIGARYATRIVCSVDIIVFYYHSIDSYTMHTYKRWGPAAHKVFLGFCLLTNVLVTAMLLLGGAATITAMTGGHASDGLGRADQSKFE